MEFIGEVARKTADPALLRVEAEKSDRGRKIGEVSNLFRVPRVLHIDSQAGTLDFERIPNLITYTSMVSARSGPIEEIAWRVGRALARIHADLVLDDKDRRPLPEPWLGISQFDVSLHGDFTANNVCVDTGDMSLVIVDWSSAPLVGRVPTVGPRCFDVLWFVRHLMMAAPLRRTLRWPAHFLCDNFVQAYVEEAGEQLDRKVWDRQRVLLDGLSRRGAQARGTRGSVFFHGLRKIAQSALYREWQRYEPPAGTLRCFDLG